MGKSAYNSLLFCSRSMTDRQQEREDAPLLQRELVERGVDRREGHARGGVSLHQACFVCVCGCEFIVEWLLVGVLGGRVDDKATQ